MKDHQMILLSADLRKVHARLSRKFDASVAQQEEFGIRTPETAVRGRTEAPEWEEPPEAA